MMPDRIATAFFRNLINHCDSPNGVHDALLISALKKFCNFRSQAAFAEKITEYGMPVSQKTISNWINAAKESKKTSVRDYIEQLVKIFDDAINTYYKTDDDYRTVLAYIDKIEIDDEKRSSLKKTFYKWMTMYHREAIPVVNTPKWHLRSTSLPHSEVFLGRQKDIDTIHDIFTTRRTVVLHGMGGIGKTEIAVRYAISHIHDYTTIVYSVYEVSLASLLASDEKFHIDGMIRKQTADGTLQTDEEYARAKIQSLKEHTDSKTLIILDNFDVYDDPLFSEFISGSAYRVLITSHCMPTSKYCGGIEIDRLDDDTLKELVCKYANVNANYIDINDKGFPVLLKDTERHTLTLVMIGTFVAEKQIENIGEVIALLEENSLTSLSGGYPAEDYSYARLRKLLMLEKLNEKEKAFLMALALMPLEGVVVNKFEKWVSEDIYGAEKRLERLRLVRLSREKPFFLSLHPIIRDIIHIELKPGCVNCLEFINRCAMVYEKDADYTFWRLCYTEKHMFMDCYKSIMRYMRVITCENFAAYFNFALMSDYIEPFRYVVELNRKVYDAACELYGSESSQAMLVKGKLIGWKYANANLFEDALDHYLAAAKYFEEHSDYCTCMSLRVIIECASAFLHISTKHEAERNQKIAEEHLDKAKQLLFMMEESGLDAEIGYVPFVYSMHIELLYQYAKLNYIKGEYKLAAEMCDEYGNLIFNFPGDSNIDEASYNQLDADIRIAFGDIAGAIVSLWFAIEKYTEYFGNDNPRMILLYEKCAVCYQKLADYDSAIDCVSTALKLAETLYLPGHPDLVRLRAMKSAIEKDNENKQDT